jgi:hypothetical protein
MPEHHILEYSSLIENATHEFDFFRCVNVDDWVYGKTVSELHAGNLLINNNIGR